MIALQFLAGLVLLALASFVFWRIGQEDALSPRWRNSMAMESLVVLVVLGGWAGGAGFIVQSIVGMFSN